MNQIVFENVQKTTDQAKWQHEAGLEFSSSIEQSGSALEQLKNIFNLMSHELNESFDQTKKTTDVSSTVQKSLAAQQILIGDTDDSLVQLVSQFDQLKVAAEELQTLVHDVRVVLTDLNNITELMDVLSINASIEAARAGQAGRGFSVVAAELKKLVGKSLTQSEQVKGKVQEMETRFTLFDSANIQTRTEIDKTRSVYDKLKNELGSLENRQGEVNSSIIAIQSLNEKINTLSDKMEEATETMITQHNQASEFAQKNLHASDELLADSKKLDDANTRMSDIVRDLFNGQIHESTWQEIRNRAFFVASEVVGISDTERLKQVAGNTGVVHVYISDGTGQFIASSDKDGIGFNLFEVDRNIRQFYESDQDVIVSPMSRNQHDGSLNVYVATRRKDAPGIVSSQFPLETLTTINAESD